MSRSNPLLFLACFATLLLSLYSSAKAMEPVPAVHARKLAFSPDGKLVVALGVPVNLDPFSMPRHIGARVWTVADGKGYRRYPWAQVEPGWMAFSPDSQYLALPSQGDIKIVHLPTNVIQCTLDTRIAGEKFFFSPDGKWFLVQGPWIVDTETTESPNSGHRNFEIWHLGARYTDITRSQQRIGSSSFEIEYPPAGPVVMSRDAATLRTWCNDTPEADLWGRIASSDGAWQAFAPKNPTNSIQLWDATSCTLKTTFPLPARKDWDTLRTPLVFSPRNRWLLCGRRQQLILCNITEATTVSLEPNVGIYSSHYFEDLDQDPMLSQAGQYSPTFAISSDENLIAITQGVSIYKDNTPILNVYDMNTGQRLPATFE